MYVAAHPSSDIKACSEQGWNLGSRLFADSVSFHLRNIFSHIFTVDGAKSRGGP